MKTQDIAVLAGSFLNSRELFFPSQFHFIAMYKADKGSVYLVGFVYRGEREFILVYSCGGLESIIADKA